MCDGAFCCLICEDECDMAKKKRGKKSQKKKTKEPQVISRKGSGKGGKRR